MLKRLLYMAAMMTGGAVAYRLYVDLGRPRWLGLGIGDLRGEPLLFIGAGALLMMFGLFLLLEYGWRMIRLTDERLLLLPAYHLASGIMGMLVGLFVSYLLFPSVSELSGSLRYIPFLLTALCGGVGFRLGLLKKEEMLAFLATVNLGKGTKKGSNLQGEHKILDTSVIIDGRIADICKTGFIQGILVIPEFVLEELQHIADSSDLLKRNRGRRGLDILNKIQKELDVKVLIYEGDFEDVSEVDSKLVRLAKLLGGKVITNDFNLNKVCELQGVSVLNINDLANAVKPVVLPGEEIVVQVIKDGKEYGQGVAYLDDGTMIVVEGGREFIGMTLEVMVTSVLQTSAGRMIFAKPKLLEKAL
jgi:uncharacterized protein YacL